MVYYVWQRLDPNTWIYLGPGAMEHARVNRKRSQNSKEWIYWCAARGPAVFQGWSSLKLAKNYAQHIQRDLDARYEYHRRHM